MTGKSDLCRYCSKPLPDNRRPNRVYCDGVCSRNDLKRRWREQNPKSPIAQHKTGTIGEVNVMRVSIDLLQRGYSVYKAAFPAMPFEITAICCNKIVQRVKVTSGSRTQRGTLVHPVKPNKMLLFDVLAVVTPDGAIHYEPELL